MSKVKILILVAAVGLGLAFGWYKIWIEPRDAFLDKVLDCTDGDTSQAAYHDCIQRFYLK